MDEIEIVSRHTGSDQSSRRARRSSDLQWVIFILLEGSWIRRTTLLCLPTLWDWLAFRFYKRGV